MLAVDGEPGFCAELKAPDADHKTLFVGGSRTVMDGHTDTVKVRVVGTPQMRRCDVDVLRDCLAGACRE